MSVLHNDDDKKLVDQLKSNNEKAFDTLFYRYSEKIYRFSFSLLKNEEDSKEIVQEVFCRIWEKRNKIDSSKEFKSFLFTISYNLIVDQLRLRLKNNEYREFLVKYFDSNNFNLSNEIDYDRLNKQISSIIEELPPKRRRVYKLSRENGLTYKEIAKKLGISVKTVETHINLSLKHLKTRLGKEFFPVLFFLFLFA